MEEIKKEIEKIVDEYSISHKGNAQCKCISGARGHLISKLNAALTRMEEAVEKENNTKIQNLWIYLVMLQKRSDEKSSNFEANADEWNLLETIKEKIDEDFFINSPKT